VPGTAWKVYDGTKYIEQEAVTVRTTPDLTAIQSSLTAAAARDVVDRSVRAQPSCAGSLYWVLGGAIGYLLVTAGGFDVNRAHFTPY
jgi:hypothetical protein